jgi:hypothetical protein
VELSSLQGVVVEGKEEGIVQVLKGWSSMRNWWCSLETSRLKTDSNYHLFQRICNAKSKYFGLLRELKQNAVAFEDDGIEDDLNVDELPTVPCYNVGKDDVCEGIEPYAV